MNYKILDCGDGLKLEQFGDYTIIRPCPQAIWPKTNPAAWKRVDGEYTRPSGAKGSWIEHSRLPADEGWVLQSPDSVLWSIDRNPFGNIGFFSEHWTYVPDMLEMFDPNEQILNLFSYTGSSCVALAKAGYKITVVDSSKNAISTYTKNLEINDISREGQRLILEDCFKFIEREVRRKNSYGSIIVDAPSYGRGTKGEVFDIETGLIPLLKTCAKLLKPDGNMVLTLHSPRFTPTTLEINCQHIFPNKHVSVREIIQDCESGARLPSGYLVKIRS